MKNRIYSGAVFLCLILALAFVVPVAADEGGQLVSISLNFSNGTVQTITVGPQATSIKTPFGLINLAAQAPVAPTRDQIADNPGKYDGTGFDPTLGGVPMSFFVESKQELELTGTFRNWGEWYKASPVSATLYISQPGILGKSLNLANLSAGQKARMGIKQ